MGVEFLSTTADKRTMPSLRHLRLLVFLTVIGVVSVGATVTLAATRQHTSTPRAVPAVNVPPLVVPDVRGQVYVYAKGILEDAGFGFRVAGSVQGFASNHVVTQAPAPGTKVVDTGAPAVILRLSGNAKAAQGEPQNSSPYPTTALRLYHRAQLASNPLPQVQKPAKQAAPAVARVKTSTPVAKTTRKTTTARPPAFVVPGAPREPLDEMPLVQRAQLLDHWVASHTTPTTPNVRHWLFQHEWITTGARFGWWHGDIALQLLIVTDRRVQSEWGIGKLSLQEAQSALAQVQARMRAG
jgi:hypothetical protein